MTSSERMREHAFVSPGEFYAEDVNVLLRKTGRTRNHKEDRKAKQLCRQVAETLDLVLSGDCRDELLQSLHVISVVPAPNSSRLLVTVSADLPVEEFDRQEIVDSLDRQTGRLLVALPRSMQAQQLF